MHRSAIRAALRSMCFSSPWRASLGHRAIACLLTGMGKDGAQGLLSARQAGAVTVAQNEASSVVFGMPAEAIRLGGAERVLSIEEIAPAMVALASASRQGRRV